MSRVFARIFVIISVLAISEEFSKFLVKILSSPILAERGGSVNPWVVVVRAPTFRITSGWLPLFGGSTVGLFSQINSMYYFDKKSTSVSVFHCRCVVCACFAGVPTAVGSFSNKPLSPKKPKIGGSLRSSNHFMV